MLGERTYLVGEMRIADLVTLQDWLDGRWESPLEPLRPRLDAMGEDGRGDALRGIWDACEEGPPAYGSDRGRVLFTEGAGIVEVFRVVLRQHQPHVDTAEAERIAEGTSPEQYRAMLRTWRRVEPADEVQAMLGMDDSAGGNPIGWAQAVCEVCEAYGWTLEYAATLTLSQVRIARGGGKPRDRGVAVPPRTGLRERVREIRAMLGGKKGGSDGG